MAGKVTARKDCPHCSGILHSSQFAVRSLFTGKRTRVCSARCEYEYGTVLYERERLVPVLVDAYEREQECEDQRQQMAAVWGA